MAGKALEHSPCKETLLYLAAAHAKSGDYKKAYELMASEPFSLLLSFLRHFILICIFMPFTGNI